MPISNNIDQAKYMLKIAESDFDYTSFKLKDMPREDIDRFANELCCGFQQSGEKFFAPVNNLESSVYYSSELHSTPDIVTRAKIFFISAPGKSALDQSRQPPARNPPSPPKAG